MQRALESTRCLFLMTQLMLQLFREKFWKGHLVSVLQLNIHIKESFEELLRGFMVVCERRQRQEVTQWEKRVSVLYDKREVQDLGRKI